MKYALPTAMAVALLALAGCERPASTSSTTVVQPTKEKETIVQRDVPVSPPATSSTTNVTIDAPKPETTTTERSTTTERVDTPLGTATRTETTKTTR